MEKKISKLFDYQKFAGNPRLQAVIDSVHGQHRQLSMDEAELVTAAYAPYVKPATDDQKKKSAVVGEV